MEPFLKQVARHYWDLGGMENTCFVFPNRRSMVFFRKYLGDILSESGNGIPMLSPQIYTIKDFFCRLYDIESSDSLRLILELYDCYKRLNPSAEALDDFIFWGEVILQDFDDVDKYLVDAASLFRNVSDFKALQDSFDYLSERQREAVKRFLGHFRDNKAEKGVKERFASIWNLLLPLYQDFRKRLEEKKLSTEGMVYRSIAERLKGGESVPDITKEAFPDTTLFVFTGLNALNECEHLLLAKMRDAQIANFVWDYSGEEIKDKANKSSFFMQKNVEDFPQAFKADPEGLDTPEISVISVPSSIAQAKLAPYILSQTDGDPVETAFVLPDENLLLPLLNSIPPQYDSVNVTMGYPMTGSAVFTLISAVGDLQLRLRQKDGKWYFYHGCVSEVFSCGLFRSLISEEEKACVKRIKNAAKYYIPVEDFLTGEFLPLVFRPVVTSPQEASSSANHRMELWLSEIIAFAGRKLSKEGEMLLETDFAKRCHSQLNVLMGIDLEVLPATHFRLLERSLSSISVPFRGEPLKGLQIMGPLETRSLDFKYLTIMSCCEGLFPRSSRSNSFIPPELRKGFGLPTHEYQDAVWAYYFYRMIQRAQKVWLIYDSRTDSLKGGEESRYIKQLEYHFRMPLRRISASAAMIPPEINDDVIEKTQEHVSKIRAKNLSASSLKSYLNCPAQFYYQVVEGLDAADEVAESLDTGKFGTVFHKVMQNLYSKAPKIDLQMIREMAKDEKGLRKMIRDEVLSQMHSIEVSGRNLVLEEIILDYVIKTLRHDEKLLTGSGSEAFTIIGLEKPMQCDFEGFHFFGLVDRIDSYKSGEIRIVDYKTGKVQDSDILINDGNALSVVDKIFGADNKDRPSIALQLFIYDMFASGEAGFDGKKIINSIYSTGRLFSEPLPDVEVSKVFVSEAKKRLGGLLKEISSTEFPFRRTEDGKTCEWCNFKNICGR